MYCLVHDFFSLMLEVFSNDVLDVVNKNLRFAQTLTQEGLEFLPGDKNVSFVFYLMLVLLPVEQDDIFHENGRKRNLIWPCSTSGGKVILALLEEIIIFHVGLTPVDSQKPSI